MDLFSVPQPTPQCRRCFKHFPTPISPLTAVLLSSDLYFVNVKFHRYRYHTKEIESIIPCPTEKNRNIGNGKMNSENWSNVTKIILKIFLACTGTINTVNYFYIRKILYWDIKNCSIYLSHYRTHHMMTEQQHKSLLNNSAVDSKSGGRVLIDGRQTIPSLPHHREPAILILPCSWTAYRQQIFVQCPQLPHGAPIRAPALKNSVSDTESGSKS